MPTSIQSCLFARQVFFLPVTKEFVEQVIIREQPDSIVVSMGGNDVALKQTGATIANTVPAHSIQTYLL